MAEVNEFQTKPTFKQRVENAKQKAKDWAEPKLQWCREHKEILMAFGPVVIGGVFELAKAGIKAEDHREARELEEKKLHSVYDRSECMYLETKRPLTNDDYREIRRRKKEQKGLATGEALDDMGLLE